MIISNIDDSKISGITTISLVMGCCTMGDRNSRWVHTVRTIIATALEYAMRADWMLLEGRLILAHLNSWLLGMHCLRY